MKDGIYFVRFTRDMEDFGEGVVVIKNNTINGGDYVCVYTGKAIDNKMELDITQHNSSVETVFGNIKKFTLLLEISQTEMGYLLSGVVKDNPSLKVTVGINYMGEAV